MKSLLTFWIMIGSIFFVTWCTTDTNPTEQAIPENPTTQSVKATWVTICDNYLTTLQCLWETSTGSTQINFKSSYESLVQSFQNVPAEQLSQTCTTLANALREHPTLLKEYPNCNTL